MKTLALVCAAMSTVATASDFSKVTPAYEEVVRAEMKAWEIDGVAVAWVEDGKIVYEAGFGEAQKDSVFRAGSISKLFNAISVMQMVEAGKLDLDAPIEPAILPENPYPGAPAVTLRQILSHRSGLQREATVGGYFDPSEPTLEATAASIRGSVLASVPGAMTRYSNIAPSVAGHLVAQAAGVSFEKWQAEHILGPIGMKQSAWLRKDVPKVLGSHIRVADGKGGFAREATPLFDLGTIPAGNLYTTAGDLAKFLIMLGTEGNAPGGRVLKPETLAAMWKPQAAEKGAYGIAFVLGELDGQKTVGHGGAVYGHSTALIYLPEQKLGAVVIANEDIVNGRTGHLANLAIKVMQEATGKRKPVPPAKPFTATAEELEAVAGVWESQTYWWELAVDGNGLRGNFATQPCALEAMGKDEFRLNSRIHDDTVVKVVRDGAGKVSGLEVGVQKFTRVPEKHPPTPALWKDYAGCYGPKFLPIVVHEKYGRLYATTENMVDYRLVPMNRHVFAMPPGMYVEEEIVFLTDEKGAPWGVDFANMILPRWK